MNSQIMNSQISDVDVFCTTSELFGDKQSVGRSLGGESRATYLALNRVVPILNIFAASDSVSRATSASDFLFIGCGEEAGDWRRQ